MSTIESFKDLNAYKKSFQLAMQIYRTTKQFPREELYGLTSQLRRAATSIPSNIAEGYRRRTRGEYLQFLSIAYGSCGELETQLDLCHELGYLSDIDYGRLSALQSVVSRLLHGLVQSL